MNPIAADFARTLFLATVQFVSSKSDKVYLFIDARENNQLGPFASDVKNGVLVLNVSPTACPGLKVTDGIVSAPLRRSGVAIPITFPVDSVMQFGDGYGALAIELAWTMYGGIGSGDIDSDIASPETTKSKPNPFKVIPGGKS